MSVIQYLPLELVIAILEFAPSRSLCRFLCLSKELKYEIHKILTGRVQQNFKVGTNCLLATIEPLDTHGSGPTHIFDLVLLDIDIDTLNARFKINDAGSIPTLPSSSQSTAPLSPRIIGRKLDGTERWETIRQNACISLESTWRPFLDPAQLVKNVSVHVFSPIDVDHEAIFVTHGTVTFSIDIDPCTIGCWSSKIDNYAQIVVSNSLREFGDFQSFLMTAFVEEVIVTAGILLTAIEERWHDDVSSVVIEETDD